MDAKVRQTRIGMGVAILAATCAVAVPLAAAGTSNSTTSSQPVRVLRLVSKTTQFISVGFPADQNQAPPVGSRYIVQIALFNQAAQFGKPSGARVGSVELDCTFTTKQRNLCTGVAHLPDGFFAFTGANPANGAATEWYAVTGGVSAYANRQGQIKAKNTHNGNRSSVVVTLY